MVFSTLASWMFNSVQRHYRWLHFCISVSTPIPLYYGTVFTSIIMRLGMHKNSQSLPLAVISSCQCRSTLRLRCWKVKLQPKIFSWIRNFILEPHPKSQPVHLLNKVEHSILLVLQTRYTINSQCLSTGIWKYIPAHLRLIAGLIINPCSETLPLQHFALHQQRSTVAMNCLDKPSLSTAGPS